MKKYAVAFLVNNQYEILGARVVRNDREGIVEIDKDELIKQIKNGEHYENIGIDEEKIVVTQGIIHYYPLINVISGDVENKYAITVVGYHHYNNHIYYVVSYSNGCFYYMRANDIKDLFINYKPANGIVRVIDGEYYIESLTDKLQLIDGETVFEYDANKEEIKVNVVSLTSEVRIPREIDGEQVKSVRSIKVTPKSAQPFIKHLILPDTIRNLHSGLLTDFGRITKLDVLADAVEIDKNTFTTALEIEKIHLKGIINNKLWLRTLKKIKKITFDNQPRVYMYKQFNDCKNLDCSNLFKEGLLSIKAKAFFGCSKIKNVTLPKSLLYIRGSAFDHCVNAKSLRITGRTLCDEGQDNEYNKFLMGSGESPIIYCPYDYPYKQLQRIVNDSTTIVRDGQENIEENKIINDKISKAYLLGKDINPYDIATGVEQINDTLSLIERAVFREQMKECIDANIKLSNSYDSRDYLVGKNGLFVNIELRADYFVTDDNDIILSIIETDSYITLVFRNTIYLIPIDKQLIEHWIANNRLYGRVDSKLQIPYYCKRIHHYDISNIYEENGELIIELINDNKAVVSIDELKL